MADPLLDTTKSGLPSPSISPTATLIGPVPLVISNLVAKLPAVILPLVAVFRNSDSVFELKLPTKISFLLLPSKSPIAKEIGPVPTTKSTFVAKLLVVILLTVVVLRNREIVFEV